MNARNQKPPKVVMVVFSYYLSDPRVRREAEALAQNGMEVDVICLKKRDDDWKSKKNNVSIYRIPISRKRASKFRYFFEYGSFICFSFFVLMLMRLIKKIDIVHVHNMPDFLVVCSLIPKLFGAKVILDLHDPMPEVFMTKYAIPHTHYFIKLILFFEKLAIRYSNFVLTPNESFRELFISRGCPTEKIHIVMNSPQEEIFNKTYTDRSSLRSSFDNDKFEIMFHGTIVERHGLDDALRAIALLRKEIPHVQFKVYGDGDFLSEITALCDELNLKDVVHFYGAVSLEKIAESIESIDIGLIPNKSSPFTDINFPTRIFEYLCKSKPVIAPSTFGIKDYFDEDSIFFFKAGDYRDLFNTLIESYNNDDKRKRVLEKGKTIYMKYRWELQKKMFIDLIEKHPLLLNKR